MVTDADAEPLMLMLSEDQGRDNDLECFRLSLFILSHAPKASISGGALAHHCISAILLPLHPSSASWSQNDLSPRLYVVSGTISPILMRFSNGDFCLHPV